MGESVSMIFLIYFYLLTVLDIQIDSIFSFEYCHTFQIQLLHSILYKHIIFKNIDIKFLKLEVQKQYFRIQGFMH